jgi:archaellum component FlaC
MSLFRRSRSKVVVETWENVVAENIGSLHDSMDSVEENMAEMRKKIDDLSNEIRGLKLKVK